MTTTTNKSINEQIKEIHDLFDQDFKASEDKLESLHHHMKVVIQHIMKLEAKAYYINKKLDQALGLAPKTDI